jgi:hypothetical protein
MTTRRRKLQQACIRGGGGLTRHQTCPHPCHGRLSHAAEGTGAWLRANTGGRGVGGEGWGAHL